MTLNTPPPGFPEKVASRVVRFDKKRFGFWQWNFVEQKRPLTWCVHANGKSHVPKADVPFYGLQFFAPF